MSTPPPSWLKKDARVDHELPMLMTLPWHALTISASMARVIRIGARA
jgi:hypothetical protein